MSQLRGIDDFLPSEFVPLKSQGLTVVVANSVTGMDWKNFRELYWQAIPIFDTPESFRRNCVATEWSRLDFST